MQVCITMSSNTVIVERKKKCALQVHTQSPRPRKETDFEN